MIYYKKEDIDEFQVRKEAYYIPHALFDTMQYKMIRLEVKWAYVACLNVLIESPSFDKNGHAFFKDDHPQLIPILKDLAHKDVDQKKIEGYLDEMEQCDLIERQGRDIFLRKMEHIF